MKEWEDIPIYVSCLMGNHCYIMKVCHDRANYESKKRELEMEAEKLHEEQNEQQEALTVLVDKVNEQARIFGELQQQQQCEMQRGSDSRIPLLQGGSISSSGSVPRIPGDLHTLIGVFPYGVAPLKNSKNPSFCLHSLERYQLQKVRQNTTTISFS